MSSCALIEQIKPSLSVLPDTKGRQWPTWSHFPGCGLSSTVLESEASRSLLRRQSGTLVSFRRSIHLLTGFATGFWNSRCTSKQAGLNYCRLIIHRGILYFTRAYRLRPICKSRYHFTFCNALVKIPSYTPWIWILIEIYATKRNISSPG